MTDIWARLGIPPTTDQSVVRKAYAERLKQVRPDLDPAGFRALREAFEAARRMEGRPVPVAARVAVPMMETKPASDAIRARLSAGDILGAARLWKGAVAAGDLGFDEEPLLQTEIAQAMVQSPAASLGMLDAAARLMGWEEAAKALRAPPAIVDVMARRAAEAWLAELHAAAGAGWRWSGSARKRNRGARVLLRPAPGTLSRWFPYLFVNADLAYWKVRLPGHRRWLGNAIDDARVAWCDAARRRLDARIVTRLFLFTVYVLIPLFVGLPAAAVLIDALTRP